MGEVTNQIAIVFGVLVAGFAGPAADGAPGTGLHHDAGVAVGLAGLMADTP